MFVQTWHMYMYVIVANIVGISRHCRMDAAVGIRPTIAGIPLL